MKKIRLICPECEETIDLEANECEEGDNVECPECGAELIVEVKGGKRKLVSEKEKYFAEDVEEIEALAHDDY